VGWGGRLGTSQPSEGCRIRATRGGLVRVFPRGVPFPFTPGGQRSELVSKKTGESGA